VEWQWGGMVAREGKKGDPWSGVGVAGLAEVEHAARRHGELVRADLDVLGDGDGLTFVQDAEAIRFLNRHVVHVVLAILPALDMRIFLHDQGAEASPGPQSIVCCGNRGGLPGQRA
jgi:hypothetical protein